MRITGGVLALAGRARECSSRARTEAERAREPMIGLLALTLALSTLAACGTTSEAPPPAPVVPAPVEPAPPVPAPPPATSGARAPFGAVLAALPSATTIRITHGWMGLTPIGPLAHRYEIAISGSAVTAHVVCHAGSHEQAQPDPTISASDLAPILAHLATVPVSEGTYTPRIEHTDDYPDITIEIDTPSASVTFSSRSQGAMADPWQITVGTDAAIVGSIIPGEALRDLRQLVHAERCSEWTQTLH